MQVIGSKMKKKKKSARETEKQNENGDLKWESDERLWISSTLIDDLYSYLCNLWRKIGREMKRKNLRYIFKLFCLTAFAVAL